MRAVTLTHTQAVMLTHSYTGCHAHMDAHGCHAHTFTHRLSCSHGHTGCHAHTFTHGLSCSCSRTDCPLTRSHTGCYTHTDTCSCPLTWTLHRRSQALAHMHTCTSTEDGWLAVLQVGIGWRNCAGWRVQQGPPAVKGAAGCSSVPRVMGSHPGVSLQAVVCL